MTSKERTLQFIDFKQVSNRKFCIEIDVSHTYFSKAGAMSSDILMKISTIYPELNIDWIVTGRGEMLNTDLPADKPKDWKMEYDALSLKYQAMMEKYVAAVEQKDSLKQTEGLPMVVHKP